MRSSEALDLRVDNLASLPVSGWGELLLSNSAPRTGTAWTDSGRSREQHGLKHRGSEETRPVPAHPDLVEILNCQTELSEDHALEQLAAFSVLARWVDDAVLER